MKTLEQLQREQFIRESGPKTWHILHFFLSLFTAGFWLPIWLLVTISNSWERSRKVREDEREFAKMPQ